MVFIQKKVYYYLTIFVTFLFSFSFIPLLFQIIQLRITANIPYITLICILLVLIYNLFISIQKEYYIRIFFYLIALICISIILFLKGKYDNEMIENKENKNLE